MSGVLLDGIRVLDMTQIRAGPKAAKWLADAGAEVIKIESRRRSDGRGFGRRGRGNQGTVPLEGVSEAAQRVQNRRGFEQLHRNKLGLSIDLSMTEGVRLFKRLVAISDVVMENFSFGVMDRLGLDYRHLCQVRPDVIMLSMPAFGASGPYRDHVAFGWAQEHMAGITAMTGYAGGPPLKTGTIIGDPANGVHAAVAIIAALVFRARTGRGQFIDFSQLESLICLTGDVILDYTVNGRLPERTGNRHPAYAPQGVYPCRGDDKWISITVTNDAEWQALCSVIGRPDLLIEPDFAGSLQRYRNQETLDPIIEEWTRQYEHYQAMELLQAAGVRAGAVLDQNEALTSPQAQSRGFLTTLTHPDGVQHPYMNTPARFSRTPAQVRAPAPLLGEHNTYILEQLLGLEPEEIQRLEASGVTATLSTDLSAPSLEAQ
jgi:crotonobetainyl-CoA:carnitine CoA-transferase CaiB-like acyl-CoA transferase